MSGIRARKSTSIYEVCKELSRVPSNQPSTADKIKRKELLGYEDNCCAYCSKHIGKVNDRNGDHFYPMVHNSRPTKYCDDFWNRVPCCKECNSSKTGKTFWEWTQKDVIKRSAKHPYRNKTEAEVFAIVARFQAFDEYAATQRYTKHVPEEQFAAIVAEVEAAIIRLVALTGDLVQHVEFTRESSCVAADKLTELMAACNVE